MIAYKVVREVDGRLFSCAARGRACLQYKPGRTVRAPYGTALFAFWDEKTARERAVDLYLNTGYTYEVWACSGKQSSLSLERIANSCASWYKMLRVWWGDKLNRWNMYSVPSGTVFMDHLKLEEKLMRLQGD